MKEKLSKEFIEKLSKRKKEPEWMRNFRPTLTVLKKNMNLG